MMDLFNRRRCKCLCIVMNLLDYFENGSDYLTRETIQLCVHLINWVLGKWFVRGFLVLLINFFSLFSFSYACLTVSRYLYFLFLQIFWCFLELVILFLPFLFFYTNFLSIMWQILIANYIPISGVYILIVGISFSFSLNNLMLSWFGKFISPFPFLLHQFPFHHVTNFNGKFHSYIRGV